jgi:hypothetical protein
MKPPPISNVMQLPGTRYVPPTPPIVDALMEIELELARARLAQIQLETRQAGVLWFWYCAKRVLFFGLALWLLTTCAQAQTRSFYDDEGRFVGSSIQRGKWTNFHNGQGRFDGSTIRNGKWENTYDGSGRYVGSVVGPRR